MNDSPLVDSCFVVLIFSLVDDPIACLNKEMAFLIAVASSRFPSTNNQLITSSNPRNQATIQDGRVIVQQVQGRQGQRYSSNGYKSNATSSRGNNASGKAKNAKAVLMANISNYGSDVISKVVQIVLWYLDSRCSKHITASKTKSWLWHHRLSHLNFDTLKKLAKDGLTRGIPRLKFQNDHLCSACALGKSKKSSHQPKAEDTNQEKLYLLHMDLYSPMRVACINGKRYILVIVDGYSRFTWVRFLRTKDEAPEAIIKCIKKIQVRLNATVCNVRTNNGTEFINQTLREFFENVGILHQTSVARTPQQNGVVEKRNRILVEVARTILIFSKAPLFL
ncbi:retrovirus-related pol polyprotein from transposon TNT 1-94 [Tanacetum coccineum]